MRPAERTIDIYREDDFALVVRLSAVVGSGREPLDVTGYWFELALSNGTVKSTTETGGAFELDASDDATELRWRTTPNDTCKIASGQITTYRISAIHLERGRHSWLVGRLNGLDVPKPGYGDTTLELVVSDAATVVEVVIDDTVPEAVRAQLEASVAEHLAAIEAVGDAVDDAATAVTLKIAGFGDVRDEAIQTIGGQVGAAQTAVAEALGYANAAAAAAPAKSYRTLARGLPGYHRMVVSKDGFLISVSSPADDIKPTGSRFYRSIARGGTPRSMTLARDGTKIQDVKVGGASSASTVTFDGAYFYDSATNAKIRASLLASSGLRTLDLWLVICQSNGLGGAATPVAYSTVGLPRSYTSPEGPWATDTPGWTAPVLAVETVHRIGTYGETGHVQMLRRRSDRINSIFGARPWQAVCCAGAGGTRLRNLWRGTTNGNFLLAQIDRWIAWALGAGGFSEVTISKVLIVQGEEDSAYLSPRERANELITFRREIEEDIRRRLPRQAERVKLYVDQIKSAQSGAYTPMGVPLGDVLAAELEPELISLLACNSDVPSSDGTHHTNAVWYSIGFRRGDLIHLDHDIAARAPMVLGKSQARRLSATTWAIEGEPLNAAFVLETADPNVPTTGLEFGRAFNGYGFEFTDFTGSPPVIKSVGVTSSLVFPNKATNRDILIEIDKAPADNAPLALFEAMRGGAGGGLARTLLRDATYSIRSDRDVNGNYMGDDAGLQMYRYRNRSMMILPR